MLDRVLPALDRVGDVLAAVAMALVIVLIGVTIFEVIARYVFSSPTIWSYPITYMTNGSIFLLGAAYTLRLDGHVRIDFLSTRLSVRAQHAINLAFYILVFMPSLAITAYASWGKAIEAYLEGRVENMSVWQPLIWPFLTGIALGVTGLLLQVAIQAIRHGIGCRHPDAVSPPGEASGAAAGVRE